jgi:16S rRNA (guanine527-N7)-methyltransferase
MEVAMDKDFDRLLLEGAKELGVNLDGRMLALFNIYKDTLKEWNKKINLTAIEEDPDIAVKHFIDSLTIIPYISGEKINLLDVGTGAGFPGIPAKIVFKNLKLTLLDSLEKRIKFLNELINILEIKDALAIHGRAEDLGQNPRYREKFDVCTARAVASLPVLLEYCLPFVRIGGTFIAMKGSSLDEVGLSQKALNILGGEIDEIKRITLPFSDIIRNIIIVKKMRHTSTKYPRKAGKPSKKPLI